MVRGAHCAPTPSFMMHWILPPIHPSHGPVGQIFHRTTPTTTVAQMEHSREMDGGSEREIPCRASPPALHRRDQCRWCMVWLVTSISEVSSYLLSLPSIKTNVQLCGLKFVKDAPGETGSVWDWRRVYNSSSRTVVA